MGKIVDSVYRHSPVWVQNLGISVFGLAWQRRRFGGVFKEAFYEFKLREQYTSEEWTNYQTAKLKDLLVHAASFVPYYRDKWQSCRFKENDIDQFALADLGEFPVLEKDSIRGNPNLFLSEKSLHEKLHTYLTSGTTGTPLAIKFSSNMHQSWSAAYEARCRNWSGVNRSMSRAMIGGRLVVPDGISSPPFWRYNMIERQLYFSAFHISPNNSALYVEALNKYRPDYLVGYASSWFFLSRFILEKKLALRYQPKAILTSSEKLTDEMRATMENAFGAEVFDAYSGVEACCLASECGHHRLHVSPDVGIVELLDEEGKPVAPGQPGEIVATGLLNYAQPLIRYRTGDVAVLSDEKCPCGREMPILKELVGRLEDTVVGVDGRETVRFHGIFVGLPHVREGQIIQESLSLIRLRLAVTPDFNEEDRSIIKSRFVERLGPVQLQFEYVDEIERTSRGKFRAVISKVQRQ